MSDPYTTTSKCIERLLKEYNKHNRLIVAVDFDDTVYNYHSGENATHERVLNVLRKCNSLSFYVVIWTASDPSRFDMIRNYMSQKGIKIATINENPIDLPFGLHKKIYYNILLDDRAGLGQSLDTLEAVIMMLEKNKDPQAPEHNSSCNKMLQEQNLPYPRTCKQCGHGPCSNYMEIRA